MDLHPAKEFQDFFSAEFHFFRTRKIPFLYNTLSDKDGKLQVFDVDFTEGAFLDREEMKATVMYIQLDFKIPGFMLNNEGLLDFIYGLAGFMHIDLDNHPDFNKRFFLSGEDKKEIQKKCPMNWCYYSRATPTIMSNRTGKPC